MYGDNFFSRADITLSIISPLSPETTQQLTTSDEMILEKQAELKYVISFISLDFILSFFFLMIWRVGWSIKK